jgi:hypothetical protein
MLNSLSFFINSKKNERRVVYEGIAVLIFTDNSIRAVSRIQAL